jgi:hypothetical protein
MKRSLYLCGALLCSEVVNGYLNGAGLVGQSTNRLAVELLVGKLVHHRFEQTWFDDVGGGAVVIENRYRAVICLSIDPAS